MTQPITNTRQVRLGLAATLLASVAALPAAQLGDVDIHGSVSLTGAYSPAYNYLGDTKESLDHNQTEIILNGTKRFDNGLKLAAQIYAYELAGYEDLTLDFASLDYSFRREIGVRVGRNKLPLGLYTESQDLDQVRVFASLPLHFYPKALRAFGGAYDGAAVYGNIGAGDAGDLDYQVYAGYGQDVDPDHPFMRGLGSSKLVGNELAGASLFWNTPISGLRVGYSTEHLMSADLAFGPMDTELIYTTQVLSAEYTRDKWTFAAEHKFNTADIDFVSPFAPDSKETDQLTYVQVAYQLTDQVGLGVYHSWTNYETGVDDRDTAAAVSYAPTSWWLLKAEAHLMDGLRNLGGAGDLNPGATDDSWTYFVVKSTFTF